MLRIFQQRHLIIYPLLFIHFQCIVDHLEYQQSFGGIIYSLIGISNVSCSTKLRPEPFTREVISTISGLSNSSLIRMGDVLQRTVNWVGREDTVIIVSALPDRD